MSNLTRPIFFRSDIPDQVQEHPRQARPLPPPGPPIRPADQRWQPRPSPCSGSEFSASQNHLSTGSSQLSTQPHRPASPSHSPPSSHCLLTSGATSPRLAASSPRTTPSAPAAATVSSLPCPSPTYGRSSRPNTCIPPRSLYSGTWSGGGGGVKVQGAIATDDEATINERNKQREAAPKIYQFKDAGPNCAAVGGSPRFKVYEVDFGWGKPEGVRSGSNNRFDGMVHLYQGKAGGRSIDVEISLEAGAMERLEMDKAFLMDS